MNDVLKVKPLPIDQWDDSLAFIKEDMNGRPINVHRLMAHHPELLKAWWNFRNYSVQGGELGKRNGELVILRVATHMKAWYEWGSHVERGLACGLSREEIERVKSGGDAVGWSDSERLLLNGIDELIATHGLSPQSHAQLREYFSVQQIMDIIAIHGMYVILGCMINTWGLELDQHVKDKLPEDVTRAQFETDMTNTPVMILDGGMGRELKRRGAPFRQPEWSALAMMEAPEIVREVHDDYIKSGAQLITTNSYALVPFHIGETVFKEQALSLAKLSGEVARHAADASETSVQVAGSLAPLFGSYRADLFEAENVEALATPLIQGLEPYVDLWLSETQSLIAEPVAVKAMVDKLTDSDKPFWVAFTLEDSLTVSEPVLRSGETVVEAIKAMHDIGVDAVLFNCCQPEVIEKAVQVARETWVELGQPGFPLGAYANSFQPQPKDAKANENISSLRDDLNPPDYLSWAKEWQKAGASLIGGCCGIGPEHIAVLSKELG